MGVAFFSPEAAKKRNDKIIAAQKMIALLEAYRQAACRGDWASTRQASEAIRKLKAGEDV